MDSILALKAQEKGPRPPKQEEKSMGVAKRKTKHEGQGDILVKPERKRRKVISGDDGSDDEVKTAAMRLATEIKASLSPQFPSMLKCMLPSHVTGGFWLGIARKFCEKHLPTQDTSMILEDEDGIEYNTRYLAGKTGLSGGWRGFSIAHNLLIGDVLVFHLVKPTKFKVYIARANALDRIEVAEVEGARALNLLKLDTGFKQTRAENQGFAETEMEDQDYEPLSECSPEETSQKNHVMACDANYGSNSDLCEHDSDDLGLALLDGIRFPESSVDFSEVRSFENFDIVVNGLVINCELAKHLQRKYYDLCCSKRSFLHRHLIGGLNVKLIAGVIAETINIADAIRVSKLTSSQDNFVKWKTTLQAFQALGMNVGFLISRLDQIMNLADKAKRSEQARVERLNAEEELKNLEAKMLGVRERVRKLDEEAKTLDAGDVRLKAMVQEIAKAPW